MLLTNTKKAIEENTNSFEVRLQYHALSVQKKLIEAIVEDLEEKKSKNFVYGYQASLSDLQKDLKNLIREL